MSSSINVQVNRNNNIISVGINSTGPQGQSAYETWLSLGNTGTKQDFINSQFDEPTRVLNENTRKQSELTRIENENARIEAENIRQQQENLRQQEFETNEVTRQTNETIRISNEEARQEADVLRGQTVEAIEQHYAPRLTTVEGQINNLDAKVVWKALDFKTESAKPSAYPEQQTTMFVATQAWQGFSNVIIKTEKYNSNIAIQYLEPNGSLTTPIMYRLSIPDTDTWGAWNQLASVAKINDLAGVGRTTETVKKNADDILKKMPISTGTAGAVGEFKKIQGSPDASLALPTGGTWEYQAYWVQTSTGYAAFIGGGGGSVSAGGTQILSAQTGYTPIAFVRRIA